MKGKGSGIVWSVKGKNGEAAVAVEKEIGRGSIISKGNGHVQEREGREVEVVHRGKKNVEGVGRGSEMKSRM